MRVNVNAAKTQLPLLLDRAQNGEEVVITRNGRAVAKLVAARVPQRPRKLGVLRGKIRVAKDFDAPLPDEIVALFEGSD